MKYLSTPPFVCSKCGCPPKIDAIDGRPPTPENLGWRLQDGSIVCPLCAGLSGQTCVDPYPTHNALVGVVRGLLHVVDRFVKVIERDYWLDGKLRTVAEAASSCSQIARETIAGESVHDLIDRMERNADAASKTAEQARSLAAESARGFKGP